MEPTIPQPPVTPPPLELPPPPANRRVWVIVAIIIAALALTAIIALATVFILLRQQPASVGPAPASVTQTVPTLPPPSSKFATDAGVLKLRDDLKTLMGRIDSVDFFESEISPPSLDLNIAINP